MKGANWRDVRTPFQRGELKFGSEVLTRALKDIIRKHVQVEKPRAVRAQVPRPSQLSSAKPMPTLGDTLCDALQEKERALEEEQRRLNELHDKENIPRRQEKMPEFDSLINKKIAMLWTDTDDGDSGESMLRWYYGTVESIKNKRGRGSNKSCVAAVKWDVGGDELTKNLIATHGRAQTIHLGCGPGPKLSRQHTIGS